jgi:predicted restriction endonuclease
MAERTITWKGASGREYKYWIYDIGYDKFDPVPANYIFTKETESRTHKPIYIGETGDITERFDYHHKIDCIRRNGATHINAHKSSSDKETRCKEETDLINKWHPICND